MIAHCPSVTSIYDAPLRELYISSSPPKIIEGAAAFEKEPPRSTDFNLLLALALYSCGEAPGNILYSRCLATGLQDISGVHDK